MANGKGHDFFNLLGGVVLAAILFVLKVELSLIAIFLFTFILSTLCLGPDLDIMPKKRAGVLRFFLYPYSLIFKHRGLSHSILWGTLSRVAYLAGVGSIILWLLFRLELIQMGPSTAFQFLSENIPVQYLIWGFFGLFAADLLHIILDWISSSLRRLF